MRKTKRANGKPGAKNATNKTKKTRKVLTNEAKASMAAKRAIRASWAKKANAHAEAQTKRAHALAAKFGITFPFPVSYK